MARLQELKDLMGEPPEDLEEIEGLQVPEEKDGASRIPVTEVVSGVKAALAGRSILVMLAALGMQCLLQKAWEKVRPFRKRNPRWGIDG